MLTAFQVRLDHKFMSHSGGEEVGSYKGKSLAMINPWHAVDFTSEIFLAQSCLGKFLIYYVVLCNFYNLLCSI